MDKALEDYGNAREIRKATEIALKMIADKFPLDVIARCTELPIEKVKSLQASQQA